MVHSFTHSFINSFIDLLFIQRSYFLGRRALCRSREGNEGAEEKYRVPPLKTECCGRRVAERAPRLPRAAQSLGEALAGKEFSGRSFLSQTLAASYDGGTNTVQAFLFLPDRVGLLMVIVVFTFSIQELRDVVEYEEKFGAITLDPSSSPSDSGSQHSGDSPSQGDSSKDKFYFSVKNPHACSPKYIEMYYKKSHLIIRMLEFKIGNELMMQVISFIHCVLGGLWSLVFLLNRQN